MVIFRESNISNDRCWILDVEIVCLFLKVDTLWHLYYVYMLLHYNINHSQNIKLLSWLQLFSSVTMTLDNPCVICNLTCSLICIYIYIFTLTLCFYVFHFKICYILKTIIHCHANVSGNVTKTTFNVNQAVKNSQSSGFHVHTKIYNKHRNSKQE